MKKITVFPALLLMILLSACVEHELFFQVHPDGGYTFRYLGKGDEKDLTDSDFPVPRGDDWYILTTFGDTVDTHEYYARREFRPDEPFPDGFFTGDSIYLPSLLKHPFSVQVKNRFVKKTYFFEGRMESRRVDEKYPGISTLLSEGEEYPGWSKEVLEYLFSETITRLDVGFNREPGLIKDVDLWLESVNDTTVLNNYLQIKSEGLERVKSILDPGEITRMDSIFKQLEDESRITLGLIDDRFSVKLIIPGDLEKTNADTTLGDTLLWEFTVNDFSEGDYVMTAVSHVYDPFRYKLVFGFLLALVVLALVVLWKKRRLIVT